MQEEYSGAIYIVGPGHEHNYGKDLGFLNSKFKKVVVIGDGEMDILYQNNEGPLQNLKTLSQDYPELLNEGKILVYVSMHGLGEDDGHYVQVGKKWDNFTSKKLFELLAESIKKPIDIIFTSCHGKAALKDIDSLTLGSNIIIFSDADKSTFLSNIASALKAISNDKFSLDNFYNNYLARVFSMDESPAMFTAGGETMDPIVLSKAYLGNAISETSRQYIQNNFGQSICKHDIICHNKIDYLMDKIEQNVSIDVFRTVISKKYLKVIFEFDQMQKDYALSRNTHHDQDVIYNHKKSEFCYIEVLELKNKIDQLFLERKIALELDLSEQDWYEIDYDYSGGEVLNEFMEHSDAGIYNLLSEHGFLENNSFDKPEYEEYGLALGIIKDIHLSLNS